MDTMTMWTHMGTVARSVVFLLALFSIWSLAVTEAQGARHAAIQ